MRTPNLAAAPLLAVAVFAAVAPSAGSAPGRTRHALVGGPDLKDRRPAHPWERKAFRVCAARPEPRSAVRI